MATVEAGVWGRVTGDVTVTALIVTRMFDIAAPEGTTLPYVVSRRTDTIRQQAFGSEPGNATARLEIDMIANTPEGARALAKAVRDRLHRWKNVGGAPDIDDVFLDNEEFDGNTKDRRFTVTHDYLVFYREDSD